MEYYSKRETITQGDSDMKKLITLFATGALSLTLLAACGNEEEEPIAEENDTAEAEVEETETVETEQAEENDDSEEKSEDGDIDDQLGLKLGEIGLVQTAIGNYELTVHSGELTTETIDGLEPLLDETIILNMTFKNVSDRPINAEDIMINLGVRTNLEGSDNTNAATYFDSIENFEGSLEPGESRDTQFISDTRTADEYYFGTSTAAAVSLNDVKWTILDEELRD